jgi:hypothetical protein
VEKSMSRFIFHRLLFASLLVLLLAGPLGAAPSPPAGPESVQPTSSLLDTFLTFLSSLLIVDSATLDSTDSGGGGATSGSGSCIDPLGGTGCPKG